MGERTSAARMASANMVQKALQSTSVATWTLAFLLSVGMGAVVV
jgi:hypothetical protein